MAACKDGSQARRSPDRRALQELRHVANYATAGTPPPPRPAMHTPRAVRAPQPRQSPAVPPARPVALDDPSLAAWIAQARMAAGGEDALQGQGGFNALPPYAWQQTAPGPHVAAERWLRDPPHADPTTLAALAASAARMPQDADRTFGGPDAVARRAAAGEALSMRKLPGPCHAAFRTLGFAPPSYPSHPRDAPKVIDAQGFFDGMAAKLADQPELLFFAFYLQPGTTQQLAAAAALHSLNWRFHTQYKHWYQWPREQPASPQVGAGAYEQGLLRFWDKDSWCMRDTQPDLTFSYAFMQ